MCQSGLAVGFLDVVPRSKEEDQADAPSDQDEGTDADQDPRHQRERFPLASRLRCGGRCAGGSGDIEESVECRTDDVRILWDVDDELPIGELDGVEAVGRDQVVAFEAIGVGFFALAGLFFLLLPLLDRHASAEEKSPALMLIFLVLLAYAAVFETIAWIDPGVDHPPEVFAADTYSLSSGMVSLALMWLVIAFSVFYLRRLLQENTRSRWLYENQCD